MPTETELRTLLTIGEPSRTGDDPRLDGLSDLARQMGDVPPDKDAPVREVLARMGDNWSALILKVLATGTYRHATLKRVIAALSAERDISQRMLTLRLRALERDGFVARREHDTVPPRVDYALTDLGRGLAGELDRVIRWIEANGAEVEAARARFGE
jgi:DNA-binding HxlR family transcriptional regulator